MPGPAALVGEHSLIRLGAEDGARTAIAEAIIADAGHTHEDAPKGLELAATTVAEAALLQAAAFQRLIELGGPLASSGRVRRAFVVWERATDRLDRALKLTGIGRKARHVDPLEAVRQAVERANGR